MKPPPKDLTELCKRFNTNRPALDARKSIKWDYLIQLARAGDYLPLCKILEDMGPVGQDLSKLISDAIARRLPRPPHRARKSRLTRIYEHRGVHIVLRDLRAFERKRGKTLYGDERTAKIAELISRLPAPLRDRTTLDDITRALKNLSR